LTKQKVSEIEIEIIDYEIQYFKGIIGIENSIKINNLFDIGISNMLIGFI